MDCGNVVPDALSRREEFQAMRTIQTLWLMCAGEGNLWCKIREGYINYPEAQKLLDELRKSKVLKEVKSVDRLFKCKQSWVYVPQGMLRLSVWKEECESPIAGHRRERKNRHRMVSWRYHWRCIKKNIAHFVKPWMKCQVKQASYKKKGGFLQPLPIPSGPWHSMCIDLITSLLESHVYNTILLMVKRFAKSTHMVPIVGTATALETT